MLPAHQPYLSDMERPTIDLGVAGTAIILAELDLLLGRELDPALARRIRFEANWRCFKPYLERHDHWWLYNTHARSVNNWTAVCNAGVVGAALYLEPDLARTAEMIARAARSLDDYLETFDADGGSTEGPGYWSYGFGNYVLFGHLIEQRTEGRLAFLGDEQIRNIAQFPLRTVLSDNLYVNFSDCDRHVKLITALLAFLGQRFDLPGLLALARTQAPNHREQELTWRLRSLFWRVPDGPAEPFVPNRHDWYGGMMWMLARYDPADPNALVLAAKGGHNGEMHNQNDVGNIIVHVDGESLIADVGRGRYTRQYFGPQRYEHFVNSSAGHSVPVPNGQLQLPGKEHGATLLDHRADQQHDLLSIDLAGAYPPEARLESLTRTVTLHRAAPRGRVELIDTVRFTGGPGTLDSVLTTFGPVEVGPESLSIRGERGALRVAYDPAVVAAQVEVVKDVDIAEGPADVNRIVFSLHQPAQEATIRLVIEPA